MFEPKILESLVALVSACFFKKVEFDSNGLKNGWTHNVLGWTASNDRGVGVS